MPDVESCKRAVEHAAQQLRDDLNSRTPTVSSDIVWAYQSQPVQDALVRRLVDGLTVGSIASLLPDLVTRRRRVYFTFRSTSTADVEVDGLLVQIDDSDKVCDILDPFRLSKVDAQIFTGKEGTFFTKYSTPILGSSRRNDEVVARFEQFVRDEGASVAFMRMREMFQQSGIDARIGNVFADFVSGTCVITSSWISPPPVRGVDYPDAEEQEDDNPIF